MREIRYLKDILYVEDGDYCNFPKCGKLATQVAQSGDDVGEFCEYHAKMALKKHSDTKTCPNCNCVFGV